MREGLLTMGGLLAQVSTSEFGDWISRLGFPVVVVLAAMFGKIRFEPEITGLQATIAAGMARELRLEAQIDAFSNQYETVVLPTVHEALAVVRQSAASLQSSTESSRRECEALSRLEDGVHNIESILRTVSVERTRPQG